MKREGPKNKNIITIVFNIDYQLFSIDLDRITEKTGFEHVYETFLG